jgi:DNA-3-methyladenine glycosylase
VAEDPTHGALTGRIVEVEAYIGEEDRASHARFGRTARNAVMYGEPGLAYLYLVYGMHTCLNVVTEPSGRPTAVLIRAVEILTGTEAARANRTAREADLKRYRDDAAARARIAARIAAAPAERLASGPGLVGAAFGLDPSMTGLDLCDPGSPLRIELDPGAGPLSVRVTPRVGIAYAGEPWTSRPWRLLVAGNRSVSGPARGA